MDKIGKTRKRRTIVLWNRARIKRVVWIERVFFT